MKKLFVIFTASFLFYFVAQSQIKVISNGNVAVGMTSTPQEKLHINGSVRGNASHGALRINTEYRYVDIGCNHWVGHHTHFLTNAVHGYYFDKGIEVVGGRYSSFTGDLTLANQRSDVVWVKSSTEYVGIGDSSPSYKLDVNGDIATYGILRISSDGRLKKNIGDVNSDQIDNLFKLQAKTYIKDNSPLNVQLEDHTSPEDTVTREEPTLESDTALKIGFIAQELQEYFPNLVKQDNKGYLSIDYISLIPLIVEAMKEQQTEIEILQNLVEDQELEIIKIKEHIGLLPPPESKKSTEDEKDPETRDTPVLYQNNPNPFNITTEIILYLPGNVSKAQLFIHDLHGAEITVFDIRERGQVKTEIHANTLNKGMYLYSLVVDGEQVDSKRMILTD